MEEIDGRSKNIFRRRLKRDPKIFLEE